MCSALRICSFGQMPSRNCNFGRVYSKIAVWADFSHLFSICSALFSMREAFAHELRTNCEHFAWVKVAHEFMSDPL